MAFNNKLGSASARSIAQDEQRARSPEAEAPVRLDVFVCEVVKIDHANHETGFFVMKGALGKDQMAPRLTTNGRPFLGRYYSVVGESKTFIERDRIGQLVECYGTWTHSAQWGPQFKAQFINEKLPSSPEAIEAFLASGKIKGLGEVFAKKVVDRFGAGTLKVLDETPEKLLEIPGFGQTRLDQAIESWRAYRGVYDIMAFMQLHGIGDSAALRIYAQFGDNAVRSIEKNPYALTQIPMIGFKTADRVAKSLGVAATAPFRISAALRFALEEASKNEGHTMLPIEDLCDRVTDLMELDDTGPVVAHTLKVLESGALAERLLPVKMLTRDGPSEKIVEAPRRCVSSKGLLTTEQRCASELARLMTADSNWCQDRQKALAAAARAGEELDETQRRALRNSLAAKVSVITGGPGTGKTHTIKSVISAAESLGARVILCAPTGRAAKRMEEATGRKSSTIHRLLGFGEGGFKRNEQNPLEGDVFIVDEGSMIDIWLAVAFFKALPDAANLIIVGDVDQLPPVGAGNTLVDLIESGVIPVSRLGRIHRQAAGSKIITNAHKIIHGKMPELCAPEEGQDFAFIEANGNEQIQAAIAQLIQSLLDAGAAPSSIQVLTPQKGTQVGTMELNACLRPLLNESATVEELARSVNAERIKLCRGDRVMQLKNNYEIDLFNGDVGVVLETLPDGGVRARFDTREVEIGQGSLKDVQLAYAGTIHKSQGSEYPTVIIPMSRSHGFMMSANLFYTAVTRAKSQVWLVGERQVVFNAVRKLAKQIRHTGLRSELQAALKDVSAPTMSEPDWFATASHAPHSRPSRSIAQASAPEPESGF